MGLPPSSRGDPIKPTTDVYEQLIECARMTDDLPNVAVFIINPGIKRNWHRYVQPRANPILMKGFSIENTESAHEACSRRMDIFGDVSDKAFFMRQIGRHLQKC